MYTAEVDRALQVLQRNEIDQAHLFYRWVALTLLLVRRILGVFHYERAFFLIRKFRDL